MTTVAELPSGEERELIRTSVRGFLEEHWPLDSMVAATKRAANVEELRTIYRKFAELGLTCLGLNANDGGMSEILVVSEELGRRCAPLPFFGAALANLVVDFTDDTVRDFLEKVQSGEAIVAYHFGSLEGNRDSASISYAGNAVKGGLRYVEDLACATHLICRTDDEWVMVDLSQAQAEITSLAGLAYPPLSGIMFESAPAVQLTTTGLDDEHVVRLAKLHLIARSLGAASRGFELVVKYARERCQFGQAIGRFQAVQHKLADNMIRLESVRLLLTHAAEAFDLGNRQWCVATDAAHAFASNALRQASLETHHVFGAIGYSEEHEAPHQFKRIHSDLTRLGGIASSREALASYLLDEGQDMPDYDLGEAGNQFRQETRQWLAENWPAENTDAFIKSASERRLFQVTWPKDFGGLGTSPMEQLAFLKEIERAGVPLDIIVPCEIQAHALMLFGTPEQQAEFLPKIASGELVICLGYSEPDSGSDLASLKTTAVLEGDEWVINGQKIWTTMAENADYMWLAARTDPAAEQPHAGISVFLIPMDTPGITIQPSVALYGKTFCQEFLDNVRVPKDAMVGPLNGGWNVILAALATERVIMGGFVAHVLNKFRHLLEAVRSRPELCKDGWVRSELGNLAAEIEASRQLAMAASKVMEAGGIPVHEASMSGVYNSELMERLGEAALDILGNAVTLEDGAPGAIPGELERMLRQSIMMVIGGGTNEIQRDLIAQKGLGLPR